MDKELFDLHVAAGLRAGRERTCGAKIAYTTEESAARAAAAMNAKPTTRKPLEPYPCAFCHGAVSGTVILSAFHVGKLAANHWAMSTDGGKTFTELPETIKQKTVVTGLTPGQSYAFRHRAVTRSGVGDWSQTISVLVR